MIYAEHLDNYLPEKLLHATTMWFILNTLPLFEMIFTKKLYKKIVKKT